MASTSRQRADRLVERLFRKKSQPEAVVEAGEQLRSPTSVGARLEAIRNVRRHHAEFARRMKKF